MLAIEWMRLKEDAKAPIRALPESVAFDIHAYLKSESGRAIKRMVSVRTTVMVPTGIVVLAPPKHFILVCSRSGYAKSSVFVANSPGVIDPDYTGELRVLLYNGGFEPHYVEHEHRIAQLLIMPISTVTTREIKTLPKTVRGAAGFGSTGK